MTGRVARVQSPAELGRSVRARRRELRLTQQTIADLTGLNRVTVGQLEHGKSTIQLRIVLLVVQVLGMDIDLRVRA